MRRPTILIAAGLLLLIIKSNAQQPDFNGTWEGKISVGVDLRIVFHVVGNADGSYKSTMDSPDQGGFNLPCDTTIISNGNISIEMKAINAVYTGKFTTDSTIEGQFT